MRELWPGTFLALASLFEWHSARGISFDWDEVAGNGRGPDGRRVRTRCRSVTIMGRGFLPARPGSRG
jgi:hypothetical protein